MYHRCSIEYHPSELETFRKEQRLKEVAYNSDATKSVLCNIHLLIDDSSEWKLLALFDCFARNQGFLSEENAAQGEAKYIHDFGNIGNLGNLRQWVE
jgi:hypothetical protein